MSNLPGVLALLLLVVCASPLLAQAAPAAGDGESFGQYFANHQDELAPFFSSNADDIFRLGVPVAMSMMGWVIVLTMLVGWGIDVLMSRGFSFFYAPAFADVKRSVIYATGRLFLSFVYTCLLSLAIIFSLKFSFVFVAMGIAVVILVAVALAAQIVWILYLYRTSFNVSLVFYLVVILAHSILGLLIAKSVIGMRATSMVTDFVDQSVTPRLQAETEQTRIKLADAQAARNAIKAKYTEVKNEISQAKSDEEHLRQEIEAKKVSAPYIYSQIVQAHARGELITAHDQLTVFLAKFPNGPLLTPAQLQLAQIKDEIAAQDARKKQAEADATLSQAQARADLLARAGRGEVTLSEMRRALLGKSRAQVNALLGSPSQTDTNSWGYPQRMIFNPLTNEKFGLLVYFSEGMVQSVDYNRSVVAR